METRETSHPFESILRPSPERDVSDTTAGAKPDAAKRQASATIALHWGTVIAIVVSVAAIYLRDAIDDKPVRVFLLDLHRQLGMLVLLCVPLRHIVRYVARHKDFSAKVPVLLQWASRLAHMVLYGLLIAIPLLGWSLTSAHGIDLRLFGIVPLPGLVGADSDLADQLTDYHAWLAYALMGLVFVHALAALWHHYVLHDSVLAAMLPRTKRA